MDVDLRAGKELVDSRRVGALTWGRCDRAQEQHKVVAPGEYCQLGVQRFSAPQVCVCARARAPSACVLSVRACAC